MEAVLDFLRMGGYGAYVWSAYLLTAVVMGGMLVMTLATLKRRRRQLKFYEKEGKGGRAGPDDGAARDDPGKDARR